MINGKLSIGLIISKNQSTLLNFSISFLSRTLVKPLVKSGATTINCDIIATSHQRVKSSGSIEEKENILSQVEWLEVTPPALTL